MQSTAAPKRFECKIKDATTPLAIHVKPADIKGAVCRDHQKCAIARAVLRQRKATVKWVDVGAKVVLVGTGKKTAVRYVLPKAAADQVRYFDQNEGAFAPCTIELRSPPDILKTGARSGVNARSGKAKPKAKRTARQVPSRQAALVPDGRHVRNTGNLKMEAVKIVDGKEVEWIDPVTQIDFRDDTFVIWNGFHSYIAPIAEWSLWKFRSPQ